MQTSRHGADWDLIVWTQDMSNFEKTRAIIEKYDPDYAAAQMQYGPPGVIMMQSGGRGRGALTDMKW